MCRRGGEDREAAVLDDGAFFWGNRADECVSARLGDVTLLCDGDVYTEAKDVGVKYFGESDASMCAGVFGRYGNRMPEYLYGEYAVAAYDKGKGELTLFRDRAGARPLFYARQEGRIGFASEIKGVLAFLGLSPSVDREVLRAHAFSGYGQYSGTDIYKNISDVGIGAGCVCSRLGVFPFKYMSDEPSAEIKEEPLLIGGDLACPDEDGMSRLLYEILYAFDYPQFDHLMPSFVRDARRAEVEGGAVADGSLHFHIGYSVERRDRLSTLAGHRPKCAPPKTYVPKERELKKMEGVLKGLFSETDRAKLEYIFGFDVEKEIAGEGNTAKRIRYLGMAIQTDIWYDGYRINFE